MRGRANPPLSGFQARRFLRSVVAFLRVISPYVKRPRIPNDCGKNTFTAPSRNKNANTFNA
jgi:hypothetical protein